ncbi:hypothetical protein DFH29DRAFT_918206 [Suillus ampliporus]|nr:hypothetical protein DFH29DRAFT_918206 [Suillus ampliporus]
MSINYDYKDNVKMSYRGTNNNNHISRSENTVTMASGVTLDTPADCDVAARRCSTPSFTRQYFTPHLPLHSILLQYMHVRGFFFLGGLSPCSFAGRFPARLPSATLRGDELLCMGSGASRQPPELRRRADCARRWSASFWHMDFKMRHLLTACSCRDRCHTVLDHSEGWSDSPLQVQSCSCQEELAHQMDPRKGQAGISRMWTRDPEDLNQ